MLPIYTSVFGARNIFGNIISENIANKAKIQSSHCVFFITKSIKFLLLLYLLRYGVHTLIASYKISLQSHKKYRVTILPPYPYFKIDYQRNRIRIQKKNRNAVKLRENDRDGAWWKREPPLESKLVRVVLDRFSWPVSFAAFATPVNARFAAIPWRACNANKLSERDLAWNFHSWIAEHGSRSVRRGSSHAQL